MDPSSTPQIPKVPEHIVSYCDRLVLINELSGTEALKASRVVEATLFKSKSISRHQYIRASVVDSDSNKTFYLAFERMRGERCDHIPSKNPSTSLLSPIDGHNLVSNSGSDPLIRRKLSNLSLTSLSSNSVSESLSPTRKADDKVSPLFQKMQWDSDDDPLFTFVFPSSDGSRKPLFLYELAILALIVHESEPSYLLLSKNCYHYSATIMDILRQEYNPDVQTQPASADAGKWCGVFDIGSGTKGNEELRGRFKTRISKFVCLSSLLNNLSYSQDIVARGS